MLSGIWSYNKTVLGVLTEAEALNSGPVFFVDIVKSWANQEKLLPIEYFMILKILHDLYRDDQIFANDKLIKFATKRASPAFETYSERISRLHQGY